MARSEDASKSRADLMHTKNFTRQALAGIVICIAVAWSTDAAVSRCLSEAITVLSTSDCMTAEIYFNATSLKAADQHALANCLARCPGYTCSIQQHVCGSVCAYCSVSNTAPPGATFGWACRST